MKNKVNNVLWGITFIVLGICYAGDAFGFWNFKLFFNGWWTLFIIIPCLFSIIGDRLTMGNFIGLFIGIMLLLSAQGILHYIAVGKLIIPVVLVLIGLDILLRNKKSIKINLPYESNGLEYTAIFRGQEEVFINEEFKGASMLALFGGIDLNLQDALINRDVVINATCIFGGIDIVVPRNVNVKISSIPILGGTSNSTKSILDENSFTIYINATCILGGLDVK